MKLLGGPPVFNGDIRNRWGCCKKQSFCLNWKSNQGPQVQGQVCYPTYCRVTLFSHCACSLHTRWKTDEKSFYKRDEGAQVLNWQSSWLRSYHVIYLRKEKWPYGITPYLLRSPPVNRMWKMVSTTMSRGWGHFTKIQKLTHNLPFCRYFTIGDVECNNPGRIEAVIYFGIADTNFHQPMQGIRGSAWFNKNML